VAHAPRRTVERFIVKKIGPAGRRVPYLENTARYPVFEDLLGGAYASACTRTIKARRPHTRVRRDRAAKRARSSRFPTRSVACDHQIVWDLLPSGSLDTARGGAQGDRAAPVVRQKRKKKSYSRALRRAHGRSAYKSGNRGCSGGGPCGTCFAALRGFAAGVKPVRVLHARRRTSRSAVHRRDARYGAFNGRGSDARAFVETTGLDRARPRQMAARTIG